MSANQKNSLTAIASLCHYLNTCRYSFMNNITKKEYRNSSFYDITEECIHIVL